MGAVPRWLARLRRDPPAEAVAVPALVLLSVLAFAGSLVIGLEELPVSAQVLPLLGGALLLHRRSMRRLLLVVTACVAGDVAVYGLTAVRPGNLAVLSVAAVVLYDQSRSREETGLVGMRGESVLVELRDRLLQQGRLPALPKGWAAEAVVRPAGGGPFAGDFVVSARNGAVLEVVLVDVSGKGVDAGTRALLLSGAMGGLLGTVPAAAFLSGANDYLCRQDWVEGFATAVHLRLDLATGAYTVDSAGHPPVAVFHSGSGRWSVLDVGGPALGLLPHVDYDTETGRLAPGDALLLYTDGLVEVSGRDLSVGIDKLLGEAERLVPRGFAGGGDELVNRVSAGSSDDRGLVLLWRER